MIGSRLGPYEITAKLGEGGMGEVYRATDTKLKRDVAIKVLPAAFTEDKERLARFEREAQLLAQLHHPNIAHLRSRGVGRHPRSRHGARGGRRWRAPRAGAFAITESLSIALQIAQALEEAHERGIVHRDFKPRTSRLPVKGKSKSSTSGWRRR